MDDEKYDVEIHEVAAAALADRSLTFTLLVMLEERGVLSREDVDIVADAALTGVENAADVDPRIRSIARRMLELTAKNLADTRKRPRRIRT